MGILAFKAANGHKGRGLPIRSLRLEQIYHLKCTNCAEIMCFSVAYNAKLGAEIFTLEFHP